MSEAELFVYDALILAGGRARRMGGVDKLALRVGEQTLFQMSLAATASAGQQVVVGPAREGFDDLVWCREVPAFGGPLAAIEAGLQLVRAEVTVVLAADTCVAPGVVEQLLGSLSDTSPDGKLADGAVALDGAGRPQYLVGAYKTKRLRTVISQLQPTASRATRELYRLMNIRDIAVDHPVIDCDTPEDARVLCASS